jgi:serpin B
MSRYVIAIALLTAGCSQNPQPEATPESDADPIEAGVDELVVIPARTVDPSLSVQESLVLANSDLAFDLYSRLRQEPGNLVFSPYIISNALAMCYAAAGGRTEAEIAKVLRSPFDQDQAHPAFHALNESLCRSLDEQGVTLDRGCRLWADESLKIEDAFLEVTRQYYDAELSRLLFTARGDACRDINAWIKQKTHGRLGDILSPNDLDGVRVLLACAIYFKATWFRPFYAEATKDAPFHVDASHSVQVPMMHYDDIFESFRFAETPDIQVLELAYNKPYKGGGECCMLVLLPKRRHGLRALERTLTTDNLNHWIAGLEHGHIEVYLPRFSVKSQFPLSQLVSEMGAKSAFSATDADFSRMSSDGGLFLGAALHAATINVDEKGTEAAATQLFVFGALDDSKPILFRADHPFVFLIRHNPTGTILFLGRVTNPHGT